MKTVDRERIMELLAYERDTGLFRWLVDRGNQAKAGDVAGAPTVDGYIRIYIDDVPYYAHRLAWVIVTGEWPERDVDHKNLCRSDNWWDNLRACTESENGHNTVPPITNTSGHKGVSWHAKNNRWRAQIRINGKPTHLGEYKEKEAAIARYAAAIIEHYGEFARP